MRLVPTALLLASLALGLPLAAADPPPTVRLPEVLAPVAPPDSLTKLGVGQWFIVDADTEQMVATFSLDGGAVTVSKKKGPYVVPAEVAVGRKPDADDPEQVTVKGPWVYVIKVKTTGKVLLDVMPTVNRVDAAGKAIPFTEKDIIRRMLDVNAGTGPRPPPFTLTAAPNAGNAPLSTTFKAVGLDPALPYSINYGDGSAPDQSLSHTYAAAGTYPAVVTQGDRSATAVVTVGAAPQPTDPLFPSLSAAFKADGSPAACAAALAGIYRQAAKDKSTVDDPTLTTVAALYADMAKAGNTVAPLPTGKTFREVIATELDAKLGRGATVPLDTAKRAVAKEQFNRIAGLLDSLK